MTKKIFMKATLILMLGFTLCGFISSVVFCTRAEAGKNLISNHITIWGSSYFLVLLMCMIGSFFLLYLLYVSFREIDSMREVRYKYLKSGLFIGCAIVFFVFIYALNISPVTDSFRVIDQALTFLNQSACQITEESANYSYFCKFGNNNFLTITYLGIFRFMKMCSLTNYEDVLTYLNAVLIFVGLWFSYHIVKRVWSEKTALKFLVLCVLNPLLYLSVFWVYSATSSFPFIMGVIYFAIRAYDAEEEKYRILHGFFLGIFMAIGYLLRPTSVIPVIAAVICVFLINRKWKERLQRCFVIGIAMLTGLFLAFVPLQHYSNQRFTNVAKNNFPISHWVTKGMQEVGRMTGESAEYTLSFETKEEKNAANMKRIKEQIQQMGIVRLGILEVNKTSITWGAGTAAYPSRFATTDTDNTFYDFTLGSKSDLFTIYCQIYRIVTLFLMILGIGRLLSTRKLSVRQYLIFLSMLGGFAFYAIWEVKEAYAIPFLFLMGMIACTSDIENNYFVRKGKERVFNYAAISMLILAIGVFVIIIPQVIKMQETQEENRKMCVIQRNSGLTLKAGDVMSQVFYMRRDFNSIRIGISKPKTTENVECTIILTDRQTGNRVYEEKYQSEHIQNIQSLSTNDDYYVLSFDAIQPEKRHAYELKVVMGDHAENSIKLRYCKSNYYQIYDGDFSVNNTVTNDRLFLQIVKQKSAGSFY